jgi:hypothetical protein
MLARTQVYQVVGSRAMATLFMVPGSHPSVAAGLMLDYKGIEYRRIDFAPAVPASGREPAAA